MGYKTEFLKSYAEQSPAVARFDKFTRQAARVALLASAGLTAGSSVVQDCEVGGIECEISWDYGADIEGGTDVTISEGVLSLNAHAPTHSGPLQPHVRFKDADPDEVEDMLAKGAMSEEIESGLFSSFTGDAIALASKNGALGIIVMSGLALAAPRILKKPKHELSAKKAWLTSWMCAIPLVVSPTGFAAATANSVGLEDLQFSGNLQEFPQLGEAVEDIIANLDEYEEQIVHVAELASSLREHYEKQEKLPNHETHTALMSISDTGSEPAAVNTMIAIARGFNVHAVVDNGDQSEYGTAYEALLYQQIDELGRPFFFITGNHDSEKTTAIILENENAINLDSTITEINGLTIFGMNDPRFTVGENRSLQTDQDEVREQDRTVMEQLGSEAQQIIAEHGGVDIAVMPDKISATQIEDANTVLFGHTHESVCEVDGSTIYLNPGTWGGEGLRFMNEEKPPRTAKILYINNDTGEVDAMVSITLGPSGTWQFSADYQLVDPDDPNCGQN